MTTAAQIRRRAARLAAESARACALRAHSASYLLDRKSRTLAAQASKKKERE